ncbi:hypothetical protein HMPREF0653_02192 [Prevotella disiens JCM 6334 = ATCC 29426]|uniref:Uncharacterized protein n=1 Tax=Prevotella disiens JCM 6334 = ATCC 29426 TaxID=1235811 RepID=A0ABN0NPY5_9BACT|nr:hypothetical protein HMPREF0653_02192 [Prevotella disiens JCM 6334 = ATCC 29426]
MGYVSLSFGFFIDPNRQFARSHSPLCSLAHCPFEFNKNLKIK